MPVWEVLQERAGERSVVGTLEAPDLEAARLLAAQAFFRHGEAPSFFLRVRGGGELHACPAPPEALDRSWRKPSGYPRVGARYRQVRERLAAGGLAPGGARDAVR